MRTPLELELGIVVCQLAGDASLVTDIVAEVAECGARHPAIFGDFRGMPTANAPFPMLPSDSI